jgi:hypothetical protein
VQEIKNVPVKGSSLVQTVDLLVLNLGKQSMIEAVPSDTTSEEKAELIADMVKKAYKVVSAARDQVQA